MKKFMSILIAFSIVFELLPFKVFAGDGGIYYTPSLYNEDYFTSLASNITSYEKLKIFQKQFSVEAPTTNLLKKPIVQFKITDSSSSTLGIDDEGNTTYTTTDQIPSSKIISKGTTINLDFTDSSENGQRYNDMFCDLRSIILQATGPNINSILGGGIGDSFAGDLDYYLNITKSITMDTVGTYIFFARVRTDYPEAEVFEHWSLDSNNGSWEADSNITCYKDFAETQIDTRTVRARWKVIKITVVDNVEGTGKTLYKDINTGEDIASANTQSNLDVSVPYTAPVITPPSKYKSVPSKYISWTGENEAAIGYAGSQKQQDYSSPVQVQLSTANPYGFTYYYFEKAPIDGYVTETAVADPAATVFANADVPVVVTVNAKLEGISDITNIDKWTLYARKQEVTTAQQTDCRADLTATASFNFNIPKSKMDSDTSYTQTFVTRAVVFFKDGTTKYATANCISTITKSSTPTYKPPVAIINSADTVTAGDYIGISSGSYDQNPGGKIIKYIWSAPGANGAITDTGGAISYDTVGTYTVSLIVFNEHDLAAATDKKITVTPPIPTAVIDTTGTLKENRKFNISSANSKSSYRFPIDTTKTTWTITPITGGSASDIKYSGNLNGSVTKDMLIKKAGTYKITLSVTNTAGYTSTAEKVITILPDIAPVCNFVINPSAYRSPSDSNNSTFNIADASYSSDGDYISSRLYEYCYDSNNDGVFNEAWTAFSSGNNTSAVLKVNQVGRYKVRETVTEGFGQETISEFIVASDYRTGTLTKDIEVKNTAPVTSLKAYKRTPVDIAILTDYTGQKLSDLSSSLNTLKSDLYSKGADVNFNIVGGDNKANIATMPVRRILWNEDGTESDYTDFDLHVMTRHDMNDGKGMIDTLARYDTPVEYMGLKNVVQISGKGVYKKESTGAVVFPEYTYISKSERLDAEGNWTGYYDYYDPPLVIQDYSLFWVALDKFGNVWTKGNNDYGTIGDGTKTRSDGWKRVEGLSGIVQIHSGWDCNWNTRSVLAVKYDGTVYFWGEDDSFLVNPSTMPNTIVNRDTYQYPTYTTPQVLNLFALDLPTNYTCVVFRGSSILVQVNGGNSDYRTRGVSIKQNSYVMQFSAVNWYGFVNLGSRVVRKVDTITPVDSVGKDNIKNFSLNPNSDRYFIYVSDGQGDNYSSGYGNYFGFGNLNNSFLDYLNSNGFANYVVSSSADYDFNNGLPEQDITLRTLVNNSASGGALYERGQLQQALDSIKSKYGSRQEITQYALVNEKIDYTTQYSDYENDPQYASRFKFNHTDPNYFDNGYGLFGSSGVYVSTPFSSIDKVGKFDVIYSARDNPKNDNGFDNYRLWSDENLSKLILFEHRRPIAQFDLSFTMKDGSGNYMPTIVDTSLDWDHTSRADRGIQAWEWKYKEINASSWTSGVPTVIPSGQTYMISLKVQDLEGEWSYPFTKKVTATGVNLTPTVDANPAAYGWVNTDIPVTVTANDYGENDFNRTTYKSSVIAVDPGTIDGTMYQKIFPVTYTSEGIWYLHMHVFDNAGNTFYRFRGPYKIDKTVPGLTATPYERGWTNQNVTVTLNPWDALSGVQKWRYVASDNNGASWGAWTGYAWGPSAVTAVLNYEGRHKIISEITDNAGNVSYIYSGSYLIDKTPPNIAADNEGPAEASDNITINLTLSDNLSGVKETRYCFTDSPDKPDGGWLRTTEVNFAAATDQEGIWYLQVECEDNAGNISYRVFGSFEIVSVGIYDLTVTLINDIIWRDYYYEGTVYGSAGSPIQFKRREGTDIKASHMPINNYNGTGIINYGQAGIDSGCEVSFYLRTYGNPSDVIVYAHYTTSEGNKTIAIVPATSENQLWKYTFTVPLECAIGTFISFDTEAIKDGKRYGTEYWTEPWLPLNTGRNIFYISGNAMDRLKFNQSH